MRNSIPKVARFKWGGPNSKWAANGLRNCDGDGKRHRPMFPSREAAEEWLKAHRPDLQRFGRSALSLSGGQRTNAERALRILAEHGMSLTDAARAYHERAKLLKRTVTFQTLRDELVAAKQAHRPGPVLKIEHRRLLRS